MFNIYDDVAIKDKETVTTYGLCKAKLQNKNNKCAVEKKLGFDYLIRTYLIADVDSDGLVDEETIRPFAEDEFEYFDVSTGKLKECQDDTTIIVKITEVIDTGLWD